MQNRQPQTDFDRLHNSDGVMASAETLSLLRRYAFDAAKNGNGNIVEIGAYRGGSTIALALGVQDAGQGQVTSIDPHRSATGVYGGRLSMDDHQIFESNLKQFEVQRWVKHLCMDSQSAVKDWTTSIDLLWIDGDHSYAGVASDITCWTPFLKNQGVVIFDDVRIDSEVEEAIRDHLPFSVFRRAEQLGEVIVFRRDNRPRQLYICGGMQSSGSTLVSWSFLQRQDLDGVLDMDNSRIHQDFSHVKTESVWLKITIGAFRLEELVTFFEAQGWVVKPLLITRDLQTIHKSLREKSYGIDGVTGDDPPLFLRFHRYLADFEVATSSGWPIIRYEELLKNPKEVLQSACYALDLLWDEAMMNWTKDETSIAYLANGNHSFLLSKQGGGNLLSA